MTLRQYRKGCGLTQGDLADKLGVERSTVTCWETGARRPDLDTIKAIADVFDVAFTEISKLFMNNNGGKRCQRA